MPDRHTLAETEKAMSAHVSDLTLTFPPRQQFRVSTEQRTPFGSI